MLKIPKKKNEMCCAAENSDHACLSSLEPVLTDWISWINVDTADTTDDGHSMMKKNFVTLRVDFARFGFRWLGLRYCMMLDHFYNYNNYNDNLEDEMEDQTKMEKIVENWKKDLTWFTGQVGEISFYRIQKKRCKPLLWLFLHVLDYDGVSFGTISDGTIFSNYQQENLAVKMNPAGNKIKSAERVCET